MKIGDWVKTTELSETRLRQFQNEIGQIVAFNEKGQIFVKFGKTTELMVIDELEPYEKADR